MSEIRDKITQLLTSRSLNVGDLNVIETTAKTLRRDMETKVAEQKLHDETGRLTNMWFEKIFDAIGDTELGGIDDLYDVMWGVFDEHIAKIQWVEIYSGIPDFGKYPRCMNEDCDYYGQECAFSRYSGYTYVNFADHHTFICDICPATYTKPEIDIEEYAKKFIEWKKQRKSNNAGDIPRESV